MCKLFLSFHYPTAKALIKKFLKHGNEEHLEYGYGIGSIPNKKEEWEIYKCNCFHMTDPNAKKVLDNMNSAIMVGHIRNIYHENMSPQQICDEIRIENTHPFKFGDSIFMHHGDLFLEYKDELNNYQLGHNDKQFKTAVSGLKKHIYSDLKKQIKGKTDSELLFYILLSIQSNLISEHSFTEKDAIIKSFIVLNVITDKLKISNSSNIIFANKQYIAVAKIHRNNSNKELKNPDLFMKQNHSGGIYFSNLKLSNSTQLVEKNTLYIIDIKLGTIENFTFR